MAEAFFIPTRQNRIHVHQYGNGPRLLIAFHGFGESGESFALFEPYLRDDFTLYAPDLPLHGGTEWGDTYFYPGDLKELISTLLSKFNATTFSMIGYSMGGRMALALMPEFIPQMEQLILAAPDGLKFNIWYAAVTRTWLGRQLFRYTTFHPVLFQRLLKTGLRFSLVNESIYKFAQHHLRQEIVRKLVFRVWDCLKKINPDKRRIIRLIRKHHLPVHLYFGRYDRIFPPQLGDHYKDLPSVRIKITEGGHQLINEDVAREISGFLKEN